MREILPALIEAANHGTQVALATVVRTSGSAPRPPGTALFISRGGEVSGSISGGCVEAAVFEEAMDAMSSGTQRLRRFGFTDADAIAVGLTCGGIIEVFVELLSQQDVDLYRAVLADIKADRTVAIATIISHPDKECVGRKLVVRSDSIVGTSGLGRTDESIAKIARENIPTSESFTTDAQSVTIGSDMQVFISIFATRPRLIIVGAIDLASTLAHVGAYLGYQTTLCDARPLFTTRKRFPDVDELAVEWPNRYLEEQVRVGRIDRGTVLCVLSHDPKFDVPTLVYALTLDDEIRPRYIGAMGSRRTHRDRLQRLREAGVADESLQRLRSPIGLDLKGHSAVETAISIVAFKNGGSGLPLSETIGPLHAQPASHC